MRTDLADEAESIENLTRSLAMVPVLSPKHTVIRVMKNIGNSISFVTRVQIYNGFL